MSLVGLCDFWDVAKIFIVYFCPLISCEIISQLYMFFFFWFLMHFDIQRTTVLPNPFKLEKFIRKGTEVKIYLEASSQIIHII